MLAGVWHVLRGFFVERCAFSLVTGTCYAGSLWSVVECSRVTGTCYAGSLWSVVEHEANESTKNINALICTQVP